MQNIKTIKHVSGIKFYKDFVPINLLYSNPEGTMQQCFWGSGLFAVTFMSLLSHVTRANNQSRWKKALGHSGSHN